MAKSLRPPRGCFWPALVIGLLLLVLGILSFSAMGKIWKRSNEVWSESLGVVDEPYLDEYSYTQRDSKRRTSKKTLWSARVKYHYFVADDSYTGDAELLDKPATNEDVMEVRKILDRFPAEATLAVYYNPAAPNESRLTPMEPAREFYLDVMFSSLYTLCGIGLLAVARGTLAAGRTSTGTTSVKHKRTV